MKPDTTTKFLDDSGLLQAETKDFTDIENRFWWLAGSVEAASDHPLARSIVQHAQSVVQLTDADEFKATEGRGVSATVWGANSTGVEIFLGNRAHLESANIAIDAVTRGKLDTWAVEHENSACTLIFVHTKTQFIGAIAVRDSAQQGVTQVIRDLQDSGIHVVMCTGDNKRTAQAIADEVGIIDVVAEQLPSDKVACVRQCQADFGPTCMVGDGINDAPALAQADLGVSIGAGVYLSADSSDVILVRSRLVDFHTFLSLSRATVRCIYRNFIWAFMFNGVCLPIATGIFYPFAISPMVAGIAMAMSSVLVVTSSLTLRYFEPTMTAGDKPFPAGIWGGIKKGARKAKRKLKGALRKKGDRTRLLSPYATSQGSGNRDVAPLVGFTRAAIARGDRSSMIFCLG